MSASHSDGRSPLSRRGLLAGATGAGLAGLAATPASAAPSPAAGPLRWEPPGRRGAPRGRGRPQQVRAHAAPAVGVSA
ncbi:hypothetical protein ACFV0G_23220, partial [Kitasatospora sp. NPDC059571]